MILLTDLATQSSSATTYHSLDLAASEFALSLGDTIITILIVHIIENRIDVTITGHYIFHTRYKVVDAWSKVLRGIIHEVATIVNAAALSSESMKEACRYRRGVSNQIRMQTTYDCFELRMI
jgi:hypothetical protein